MIERNERGIEREKREKEEGNTQEMTATMPNERR